MYNVYTQGVRLLYLHNLRGDSLRRNKTKIKNKKIAFSALLSSYWQLQIDQNIPAREQTSLHERKERNLSSGAHSVHLILPTRVRQLISHKS